MLAKYVWLSGATQAQMLDDICKLFAGATISSLSASCDKVNSQILADTLPNNWAVFDAAASASAKVLRSANSDGVSYKYAHLSYASNTLSLTSYESWNASTHVGTNQAFRSTATGLTISVSTAFATTGGTLYLYATSDILMFGTSSAAIASIPLVAEFTRESPIIDATYPCHTLSLSSVCRVKNAVSAGDLTQGMVGSYDSGATATTLTDMKLRTPDGQTLYCADALHVLVSAGSATAALALGEIKGIWTLRSHPSAAFMDEVDVDGVRHVLLATPAATGNLYSWIVEKG